jgi:dTDP-4-dehydrorhamnose reductase
MSIERVLVTGANGQVGKELRKIASEIPQVRFLFLSREDLAIHHFELVRRFFQGFKPDVCINCAAYTAVDKAESEKDIAFLVNAESVGVLAAVCREAGARFIHISTDYVFNGLQDHPYREDDPTDPQSVYGASKLAGEDLAMKMNPDTVIVRTSWVYSVFGKNFVRTMCKLMGEKETLNVVADQYGSPTHARDLAKCLMLIALSKNWTAGIFHYSNEGIISWYQFAQEIARLIQSDCKIHPIPTSDYPTPARRPLYSALDKTKIQAAYGIQLVPWKDSLDDCIRMLMNPA